MTLFSPWASPHPDGLERIAEDEGFIDRAEDAPYEVIPDYTFPGIVNERAATIVAGLVGTLLTFGLGYGIAWVLRSQARQAALD
ncbi:MAG: PDGLE domain-containing protein [Anaerolineae bacterium]|nr:PDGLE domain-containing protein [Anaerolineae bacterium]